ncbi:hypothetical protein DFH11DRAFT_1618065 [Phellopilus nigrolimitatus]|nr:hypothetical protein DFH11DRAFT_1618065 [Phellopilus nigrolimitatus]
MWLYVVDSLSLSGSGVGATVIENAMFPRLCIKIALPGKSYRLSKEAWCYEEMEKLQGIAIPRCFGWSEAELGTGWLVNAPESDIDSDSGSGDSDDESGDWDSCDDSYDSDVPDDPKNPNKLQYREFGKRRNLEKARLQSSNIVSILLLEELGERLLDVPEFLQPIRDDVQAIYEDICEMGIHHGDYRPHNILRAANCVPGFPSVKCPRHGYEHQWRIIDFHIAHKVNLLPSNLMNPVKTKLLGIPVPEAYGFQC